MLLAVSFADAIHGIAVGGGGKILKTIDGGAHWTTLTSPVTNYLYGVSYIDSTTATIVGTQGKILRTVDGGSTWTQQPSGTTSYFYGVSFSDKNTGMAVGENGKILFTTNGGSSWINKSSHTAYNLYGVVFFDTTRWYAVGGSGTIVRMGDTSVIVTSAPNRRVEIAKLFRLNQNYPNPFNPTTTMSFVLDRQSFVTLRVFDVLGREIETIVNEDLSPGTHSRSWSAYYLPSGVYFYRLEATSVSGEKHEVQTKKLLLLK